VNRLMATNLSLLSSILSLCDRYLCSRSLCVVAVLPARIRDCTGGADGRPAGRLLCRTGRPNVR